MMEVGSRNAEGGNERKKIVICYSLLVIRQRLQGTDNKRKKVRGWEGGTARVTWQWLPVDVALLRQFLE